MQPEWKKQECFQKFNRKTFTGKRPLGRPRRIWEDNVRMDSKEIGINMRNWVNSTQEKPLDSISRGVSQLNGITK